MSHVIDKASWSTRGFAPSPAVRVVPVGERTALFCERSQRLFELNDSASAIWREVASGASHVSKAAEAAPLISEWLRLGYLAPADLAAQLEDSPTARMMLDVGGMVAEVRFHGEADASGSEAAFTNLKRAGANPNMRMSVVGDAGVDYVFVDSTPVGAAPRSQTVPRLKALLTEQYCRSTREGFLAHGAIVSLAGRRVLLSGPPGAGKTTLTLALAGDGFAYGGDDIVRVREDGAAEGVPFAAAAKSGAWALLAPSVPGLAALPVHEREDGKLTRYVVPPKLDLEGPRPIDVVVLLDRREGAAARIEALTPLEALCAILESGYSERRAVSARTIEGLARHLSAATCGRLVYDDLAAAVALVKRMAHE